MQPERITANKQITPNFNLRSIPEMASYLRTEEFPAAKELAAASHGQISPITFPIPLANGRAHLSTTPRWCGCRDRAFSHSTELPARDHVERVWSRVPEFR